MSESESDSLYHIVNQVKNFTTVPKDVNNENPTRFNVKISDILHFCFWMMSLVSLHAFFLPLKGRGKLNEVLLLRRIPFILPSLVLSPPHLALKLG